MDSISEDKIIKVSSKEDYCLMVNFLNDNFFSNELTDTETVKDLFKIKKLLEIFKKIIKSPETNCDTLLQLLTKLDLLKEKYGEKKERTDEVIDWQYNNTRCIRNFDLEERSESFGKKKKLIEDFFNGFCEENGLSFNDENLLEVIPNIKKEIHKIIPFATGSYNGDWLPDATIEKIIKYNLERFTVEFKKLKYLNPESFHATRTKHNRIYFEEVIKCMNKGGDDFFCYCNIFFQKDNFTVSVKINPKIIALKK